MQPRIFAISLKVLLVSAMLLLSACATISKPKAIVVPGKDIETVQSSVAVNIQTPQRSVGGRGYLVFRHPDQFHLAILSPFGFSMLEMYSDGDALTCLIPSRNIAYKGILSDLPEQGGLKSWGLLQWVVERPPVAGPSLGAREIVMADGRKEQIFFDNNGLVLRKLTEDGDEASYKGYRTINGVAFPEAIEIVNRDGNRLKITFEEPEVNEPVEDAVLRPRLDGFAIRPLTEFKGL